MRIVHASGRAPSDTPVCPESECTDGNGVSGPRNSTLGIVGLSQCVNIPVSTLRGQTVLVLLAHRQ